MFFRYLLSLKMMKIKDKAKQSDTLISTGLASKLAMELALCCMLTPPLVDYKFTGKMLGGTYIYSLNDMMVILSLTKCYVVMRLYYHYSRWTTPKVQDYCRRYNVVNINFFPFKCELKYRPFYILLIVTLVTLVFVSILIRLVE